MKKSFKRIAILLLVTFIAPSILHFIPSINRNISVEALAAETETKLTKTKTTIGVNSSPEYISLNTWKEDVTYTYSSENTKIATVNEYGMIIGVAKGKTTITVYENKNGESAKVGSCSVNVVGAALTYKEAEIGLNSTGYIQMNYCNNDAVYKLKSSDTSIVTVDKWGGVAGVKLGNATISVTETYKGKTTKIGSLTAKVVKAKLASKEMEVPVSSEAYDMVAIAGKNEKAVYKYTSSDKSTVKVDKDGYIIGVKQGKASISVTETYKKVTRKLGSLTVNVIGSSISPDFNKIDLALNSQNNLLSLINIKYQVWDATYTAKTADSSIVSVETEVSDWGEKTTQVKGVALGTTVLTIYEDYNGIKREVGTIDVTVKEYPVTGLKFSDYYFEPGTTPLTRTEYVGLVDDYNGLIYSLIKEPENTTTPIVFTSSDETIATVDSNGIITPISKGTVMITATCGKFSDQVKIIVLPIEDFNVEYEK